VINLAKVAWIILGSVFNDALTAPTDKVCPNLSTSTTYGMNLDWLPI